MMNCHFCSWDLVNLNRSPKQHRNAQTKHKHKQKLTPRNSKLNQTTRDHSACHIVIRNDEWMVFIGRATSSELWWDDKVIRLKRTENSFLIPNLKTPRVNLISRADNNKIICILFEIHFFIYRNLFIKHIFYYLYYPQFFWRFFKSKHPCSLVSTRCAMSARKLSTRHWAPLGTIEHR